MNSFTISVLNTHLNKDYVLLSITHKSEKVNNYDLDKVDCDYLLSTLIQALSNKWNVKYEVKEVKR